MPAFNPQCLLNKPGPTAIFGFRITSWNRTSKEVWDGIVLPENRALLLWSVNEATPVEGWIFHMGHRGRWGTYRAPCLGKGAVVCSFWWGHRLTGWDTRMSSSLHGSRRGKALAWVLLLLRGRSKLLEDYICTCNVSLMSNYMWELWQYFLFQWCPDKS